MILELPLLRATPPPEEPRPGLVIAAPYRWDARSAWLHLWLTLPARGAGRCEDWLDKVFVTCISKANQWPQVFKLTGRRVLLEPVAWTELEIEGEPHRLTSCSVELDGRLRHPLGRDDVHLHASAGFLVSNVVELVRGGPEPEPPEGGDGGCLLRACDELARGAYAAGAARLEALFEASSPVLDVDGCHAYNAACALCLVEDDDEDDRLARAASLLRAHLTALTAAHSARLLRAAADAPGVEDAARLDAQLRRLLRAPHEDPDLAPLRASDHFAGVFC